MAKQQRGTPAYLSGLNSDLDDVLLHGKDYLHGLPLRRRTSKRKLPEGDIDINVPSPPTSSLSLFHRMRNSASQLSHGYIYYTENSTIISVIIISASVILLLGFSVKQRSINERQCEIKKRTRRKKKKKRKKLKTDPSNGLAINRQMNVGAEIVENATTSILKAKKEQSGDVHVNDTSIIKPTTCNGHDIEKTICLKSKTIISKNHQQSNEMYEEEIVPALTTSCSGKQDAVDIIHETNSHLNSKVKFPIKEVASRWESLGLGRQKSLELAANAEINWYFYQEMKQSLSTAALHLFDQMGWHTMQILTQSEKQHKEVLNAPAMNILRKRREDARFALLNTQLLGRCICLALIARFARHENWASLINAAFSTLLSNICPGCDTSKIHDSMTNFIYYDLDSWRNTAYNLVESMSLAWFCVGRLIFCTICGLLLHNVSTKMTYGLIASVLIPWREIVVTGFTLLVTNCLLTLSMSRQCSSFDQELTRTGDDAVKIIPTQVTHKYNQTINMYQALAYFTSICIGLFEIDALDWQLEL
jgi:hypothetical protein